MRVTAGPAVATMPVPAAGHLVTGNFCRHSETLTVTDHRVARRTTEIDISS